jgi:hypothetical protein
VSSDRPFDQSVPLPSGPPARTLRDVANYIRCLPKADQDAPQWQTAIEALMDAAEDRAPMMFAKMGVLQAVNRNVERVFKLKEDLRKQS